MKFNYNMFIMFAGAEKGALAAGAVVLIIAVIILLSIIIKM